MKITKIGNGSYQYENYEIGIDSNGICYVRFSHCDWELAGV